MIMPRPLKDRDRIISISYEFYRKIFPEEGRKKIPFTIRELKIMPHDIHGDMKRFASIDHPPKADETIQEASRIQWIGKNFCCHDKMEIFKTSS